MPATAAGVNLGGSRWEGEGIERTVNGGFRSDIPITIQGELSSRRGISTQLGSGGPTVRVRTTNGGLKIGRR